MIRIYLDSSDYSNMADRRQEWAQEILAFLKDEVQRRNIELRFSAVHVLESAHTDASAKPMALMRADLIAELSGSKCLAWSMDTLFSEAKLLAHGELAVKKDCALRDDGRWFPELEGIADDLFSNMESELKRSLVDVGLPRPQRRKVLKQLLTEHGRLTPKAVEIIKAGQAETMEKLKEQFPLPKRFFKDNVLLRVASGELPRSAVKGAIEEAFADLRLFVDWAYDKYDQERKLTSFLRDGSLLDAISASRAQMEHLVEIGRGIGKTEKDANAAMRQALLKKVRDIRSTLLWAAFNENKKTLYHNEINKKSWQARVIDSPMGKIPSLDAMLQISVEYFANNTAVSPNPRSLRSSDFADVQHMAYLPYVDIFRCDGYMAGLARKTASNLGTMIVGNLHDLPEAIRQFYAASQWRAHATDN